MYVVNLAIQERERSGFPKRNNGGRRTTITSVRNSIRTETQLRRARMGFKEIDSKEKGWRC